MSEPREPRERPDYTRGLPDHHDPTAGIGGAPPAQSALTLRLVLAAFGLVSCLVAGLLWLAADLPGWAAVVLFVLAAAAAVDLAVVARRKARGEPG
jgi:membrane protein implicated in regulation of membrane protease activity